MLILSNIRILSNFTVNELYLLRLFYNHSEHLVNSKYERKSVLAPVSKMNLICTKTYENIIKNYLGGNISIFVHIGFFACVMLFKTFGCYYNKMVTVSYLFM